LVPAHFLEEERGLRAEVAEVAREEQVVAGLHHPGEAHEQARVECEHTRHLKRNALHRFVHIEDACNDVCFG